MDDILEAPSHLSDKARKMYHFYVGKAARTPGQIALLVQGLEAMGRAEECAAIIRREGLAVTSARSGLTRKHPLIDTQGGPRRRC